MKIYGYHYKKWESYHKLEIEFRNICKRKTNVKTELLIEKGVGMKMFTYNEVGYENFSKGFWEGMEIYVIEISFILQPPLVITLWPVPKAFCDWLALSYEVLGEKEGQGVLPQKIFTFLKL